MKAYLILEDGNVFEGESVGADKEVVSEFVFNTSMTGYQEVLKEEKRQEKSTIESKNSLEEKVKNEEETK